MLLIFPSSILLLLPSKSCVWRPRPRSRRRLPPPLERLLAPNVGHQEDSTKDLLSLPQSNSVFPLNCRRPRSMLSLSLYFSLSISPLCATQCSLQKGDNVFLCYEWKRERERLSTHLYQQQTVGELSNSDRTYLSLYFTRSLSLSVYLILSLSLFHTHSLSRSRDWSSEFASNGRCVCADQSRWVSAFSVWLGSWRRSNSWTRQSVNC